MKIATIVGARPQFVKASVVSLALRRVGFAEKLIHTGQHYDDNMSRVFFETLDLASPVINLGVGSGLHGAQTARMLEAIEAVLLEDAPDMVIVYGDTNSTLAGALAAAKLHIPIAHVEAGLRSFDKRMPEEVNRLLTDHVSELLFAPTQTAIENLIGEGIPGSQIHSVGDVMYDAALFYGAMAERESRILGELGLKPKQYVLATIHRAENTDDGSRFESIFAGLARVALEIQVVVPLHPRARSVIHQNGLLSSLPKSMQIIDPLGYLGMMALEKAARLIVTDSGGVQKEAFFHCVPCVTLRDRTEWVELVSLGWNKLVPPASAARVATAIRGSLSWNPGPVVNPFGDGHSAEKIVSILDAWSASQGQSSVRSVAD